MRKYGPELLMGLILSAALLLIVQSPQTAADAPAPAPAEAAGIRAEGESDTAEESADFDQVDQANASYDRTHTVRLSHDGAVQELSLREYLIGVLMSEMPMSFELEALRAQAIASRTYALHSRKHRDADVCDDSSCCQCRQDAQSLQARFGAEYENYLEKAGQAVDSTDGMVLKYDGTLIDATYFACSGGMTEDAVEVWGREVPYLHSVASPGEENAGSYHSRTELSPEAVAQAVRSLAPDAAFAEDPAQWIGAAQRTAGDGIRTLELGGAVLTGMQLRNLFDLSSTKFTVFWDGNCFCFEVYGSGHRVGLSQCGAQAMALAGAGAEQILQTYYAGVEISHI